MNHPPYLSDSPETIKSLFGSIAKRYDLTNSLLSFHLHRLWNRRLIKELSKNNPINWLDLCAGTGEIGFLFLQNQIAKKNVTFVDFCKEMLAIAQDRSHKFENHCLSFIEADATNLPFASHIFDVSSMAYGLRNIDNKKAALLEIKRVLKPGGAVAILDLTAPKNRLLQGAHRFYLKYFVPTVGGLITGNREAFSYLSSSIDRFSRPSHYTSLLEECGFHNIQKVPLLFGTAHLFLAKSPLTPSDC